MGKLFPALLMRPGESLLLFPDDTKSGNTAPINVTMTGGALCSITWLSRFMCLSFQAGVPVLNFITRPWDPTGNVGTLKLLEIVESQLSSTTAGNKRALWR